MIFAGTKFDHQGPEREPGRVCFSMYTWIVSCAVVTRVENPQATPTHPVLIYTVDICLVQPCLPVCSITRLFIRSSLPVRIHLTLGRIRESGIKGTSTITYLAFFFFFFYLFAKGKNGVWVFNSQGQKPCIACHISSFLFYPQVLLFDG